MAMGGGWEEGGRGEFDLWKMPSGKVGSARPLSIMVMLRLVVGLLYFCRLAIDWWSPLRAVFLTRPFAVITASVCV